MVSLFSYPQGFSVSLRVLICPQLKREKAVKLSPLGEQASERVDVELL